MNVITDSTVCIADVAEVISGFAFKSDWFQDSGTKVIRIGDLQNGEICLDTCVSIDSDSHSIPVQFRTREGDILMALSGATTGKTAVVSKQAANCFVNQRVALIRARIVDTQRILRYVFEGFALKTLLSRAGGVAQPNLSPNEIKTLEIPLPPLSEQKRIADILDKADAIRRKRQEAIDNFQCLAASVFDEMFSRQMTTAKWSDLSDYLLELRYGTSNKSGKGGHATLRIPNIVRGIIDLSDLKTVEVNNQELEKLRLIEGDILFVRTNGNPDNVGRCAVFGADQMRDAALSADSIIFASYLIRARLDLDRLRPVFLQSLLATATGRQNVREKCRTSAGQYNINTKGLGSLQVPIIEFNEQLAFERKLASLTPMIHRLSEAQNEANDLFNTLVQSAFKGDI